MATLDNRNTRIFWGCGNITATIVCLPLCWGLPAKDFVALKFAAAIGGIITGTNAGRLFWEHEQNAPIRSAYRESAIMVNGAWIEQLAISQLPQATYHANGGEPENYYLPQLPPQNYQSIAAENPQQPTEQPPERGSDRKMPNLSAYPSVLIYGVPGSGKTTFAQQEVQKRLSLGHEVIVLDPHAAYGSWQGCKIIGGGMDYKAIDSKLKWLFGEIKNRYSRIESEPNPHLSPLTVVAEEFTQWSAKVRSSAEFFWVANSDIRKAEIYVIFVSHTRTLIGVGGAKGAASLRDDNLLEIELQGEANEETGRATPLFQALVKMPGKSLSERFLVPIERHYQQASQPTDRHQAGSLQQLPQPPAENPGSPYGMQAEAKSPIVAQILSEPGKLPLFSPALELPHEEKLKIAKLIAQQNIGTEKLILCFWGATSGGRNHHLYVEARKMLDRLMEEIKNQPNCP